MFRRLLAPTLIAILASAPLAAQTGTQRFGKVSFENSGAIAAQPAFLRGLALLHNFQYPEAAAAFREAETIDPGFAMAYWGEAMTYNHGIWQEQDSVAARAALARLGAALATRLAKAPTAREKAYLATLDILYDTTGTKASRDSAYAAAIADVAAVYPADVDAQLFYAAALMALPRVDSTYARAGRIALGVMRDHPDHPGALHYVIHAYDDPQHATMALQAARAYSTIAANAPHAQHMVSHIFIALGMWDDVVKANEISVNMHDTPAAIVGAECGHAGTWLQYAYLEQGRRADAARMLTDCLAHASESPQIARGFASMRARQIIDGDVSAADIPTLAGSLARPPLTRYYIAYGNSYDALRRRDTTAANQYIAQMASAQSAILNTPRRPSTDISLAMIGVAIDEMRALMQMHGGKREESLATLRTAVAHDEAMPFLFGPPTIEKPPRELLGEVLLSMRRGDEARTEFTRALARTPERSLALLGLARAEFQARDRAAGHATYARLARNWHRADANFAALAEARTGRPPSSAESSQPTKPSAPEKIQINDNRVPGGTLSDRKLTIKLEARLGDWHPDADGSAGLMVHAFGEEGRPSQIPGPEIRVVEGTIIHASIRNTLEKMLIVHGLNERGAKAAASDTFSVAPGATREVEFVAGTAGTYYYWASTNTGAAVGTRLAVDSQLSGMLIVDPRDQPRRADRVFLISFWSDLIPTDAGGQLVIRVTMNGKAWPNTEHLTYNVGDSVRIRVANVGTSAHPMHLHGFYYQVNSRGDAQTDTVFPADAPTRWAVTERIPSGRTFSLTWIPTRSGNWLFHCHDPAHFARNLPLNNEPNQRGSIEHSASNTMTDMGGPVVGITVRERAHSKPRSEPIARRHLRLVAGADSGSSPALRSYAYYLGNTATRSLPRPTILLKRGEPVAITVVNKLAEPTSVHWHGIELDSYYDGVPNFAGHPGHLAPQIAPGDSFVARFTPPRSGTFIYHPHVEEIEQQVAGLSGALIVVDDPARWDPIHDIVMLVTDPRTNPQTDTVLINGLSAPPSRELLAGNSYRFRLINNHSSRPGLILKIMRDSTVLVWRPLAKDGRDLPTALTTVRRAAQTMGNGETYDFEFTPSETGALHFDVTSQIGVLLARMQMPVR